MNTNLLISKIHVSLAIVGCLVAALLIVYGRVSYFRLKKLYANQTPRTLTTQEIEYLQQWGKRDILLFVLVMVYVLIFSLGFSLSLIPEGLLLPAYVILIGLAVVGLAYHFLARCPVCDRRLGFQRGLGLPSFCEICGAVLRPGSLYAALAGMKQSSRYRSPTKILGLPLLAVAFGPDPESNQTYGVAKGIIAVGDVAVGFLAVGGFACGIIGVGGLTLALVGLGGLAAGGAVIGGLALGGLALGGIAVGVQAVGGLALGLYAHGGLAIGVHPQGGVTIPLSFK